MHTTIKKDRGAARRAAADAVEVDRIAAAYRAVIADVTPAQIETAARWYVDAETVARQCADLAGVDLERGAAIVSAFSPNQRWAINVAQAIAFAGGADVRALPNNVKMAHAARQVGFAALNGPKTNAFARAIAGDVDAVVIDLWMARAAGWANEKATARQYRLAVAAIRRVAAEIGLEPRTVQALVWIVVRGGAA